MTVNIHGCEVLSAQLNELNEWHFVIQYDGYAASNTYTHRARGVTLDSALNGLRLEIEEQLAKE